MADSKKKKLSENVPEERGIKNNRTHAHPWWIQVNVWQNQYNVVK